MSAEEIGEAFVAGGLKHIRCVGQGLMSTPFAEVVLRPSGLAKLGSRTAVAVDSWMGRRCPRVLRKVSWNIIVAGAR